jgi:hypothetical protein
LIRNPVALWERTKQTELFVLSRAVECCPIGRRRAIADLVAMSDPVLDVEAIADPETSGNIPKARTPFDIFVGVALDFP